MSDVCVRVSRWKTVIKEIILGTFSYNNVLDVYVKFKSNKLELTGRTSFGIRVYYESCSTDARLSKSKTIQSQYIKKLKKMFDACHAKRPN